MQRSVRLFGLALSMLGLAGCGVSSSLGSDHAPTYKTQSVSENRTQVRIYFHDISQVDDLARHGVDLFENANRAQGWVDASVTPKTEAYLKLTGLRYTVTQRIMALSGFPSGYLKVNALYQDLKAVAAAHPKIVHLSTIGSSLENRPITAVEITSHPDQNLPGVLIDSGQHARELPPVEITDRLIHLLAENYGHDATITHLVDTHDIWIVPLVNPDGRIRVQQGDSMWRKNVRDNGDGTFGVDPNRNANDHFYEGDTDGSADDFRGSAPFSEPESQAIRSLFLHHKFALSLDIHNYAGMVLWPPGYTDGVTKDEATFRRIGDHMAQPIGYQAGTIAHVIYHTYGDLATWEYDKYGTLAFAVELNDSGFAVPYSQVKRDWQDWKNNLLYFIGQADPQAN